MDDFFSDVLQDGPGIRENLFVAADEDGQRAGLSTCRTAADRTVKIINACTFCFFVNHPGRFYISCAQIKYHSIFREILQYTFAPEECIFQYLSGRQGQE